MISCEFEDGGKAKLRHVGVDSVVVEDGKILLVRRDSGLVEGGKWCLPGGFMERDETTKQTAVREVMEETGWEVKDQELFKINDSPIQPSSNDRQNVVFFYICQATTKTGEADMESDEQKWFELDDLPQASEIAFDHAGVIDLYKRYLKQSFGLPVVG